MRWPIALIGALALVLPALGLVEVADRVGPVEGELRPVALPIDVTGTYAARPDTSIAGFCPAPPCGASTDVDLRIVGLPDVPMSARLVGATTFELGPLARDGEASVLDRRLAADHTDKQRLELVIAERAVASWQIGPGEADLSGIVEASWPVTGTVRLAEIGMVTVSTTAKATIDDAPPAGWELRARLTGERVLDLGPLDVVDGQAVLDARVERVGLEDHDRIVVFLVADGDDGRDERDGPVGLPVAALDY